MSKKIKIILAALLVVLFPFLIWILPFIGPILSILSILYFVFIYKNNLTEKLIYGLIVGICVFVLSIFTARFVNLINRQLLISLSSSKTDKVEFVNTQITTPLNMKFTIPITIRNISESINTVKTDVNFDPNYLEIVKFQKEFSFAEYFIDEIIDNKKGFARLTGGLPNPGHAKESGNFAHLVLLAKRAGKTEIKLQTTSEILANDGRGTGVFNKKSARIVLNIDQSINPPPATPMPASPRDNNKKYYYNKNQVFQNLSFNLSQVLKFIPHSLIVKTTSLNNKIIRLYQNFI